MKVLEIEVFGRGGLTHYVYNLAVALGGRGIRTTIATAADYELESRVGTLPPGVTVEKHLSRLAHRLKGKLSPRVLRTLKGVEFMGDAVGLARRARALEVDVLHVHCTNAVAVWLLTALKSVGRPIVWTAHDLTPHEPMPGERRVQQAIYRLADHIIVHGDGDRERLEREFGIPRDHISVIPHGEYTFFDAGVPPSREEARRWLGVELDACVALFFGFIREYKGLDVLLDAWASLDPSARPRRLVVAGDPARLEPGRAAELEARARALGAVTHFRYVPFEDVARYFAAADVLVLPYRKISQSGVLLLAMSMGVPVVATRVGAFPEVITDDESGILVPPGDAKSLAAALDRALRDPALRDRLASRAEAIVRETYSWTAIAARTESLFRGLSTNGTGTTSGEGTRS